jgi:hypothetical protein
MLKLLAPIAVIPPSPKKSAWMTIATEVETTAAQGPMTIAAKVPPTACAVVPPGTGMLNIMIAKAKAEKIARSGTVRPPTTRRTRATATAQNGMAVA